MTAFAPPASASLPAPAEEPVAGNYFVAAYPPFSTWTREGLPALKAALAAPPAREPLGLYLHLPFCQQKCDYCHYLSYIGQPAPVIHRYVDAVVREMELYAAQPALAGRAPSFVYFGGGTPSLLTPALLRRINGGLRDAFDWKKIEEVTFECAPRSVREEFLAVLRETGVTRLSMGVQSMNDDLLRLNGRVHLAADVRRALTKIRAAGFDYVNLDLMAGLIGESEEQWLDSVREVIALQPESVTIYQTEVPQNTRLYRDFAAGTLRGELPSWDEKRRRLDTGFRELERAGYTVVSAYHAVRNPARHRFLYQTMLWRGADLLGLGVAAFGYFGGVHYQNLAALEPYEAAVERGEFGFQRACRLSDRDRLVREFVLQLKLGEVAAGPFRERFGVDLREAFAAPLRECEAEGWLRCDEDGVHLTRPGLLRVDRLIPRFYDSGYRDTRYS